MVGRCAPACPSGGGWDHLRRSPVPVRGDRRCGALGSVALTERQGSAGYAALLSTRRCPPLPAESAFSAFRFPAEVTVVTVRWYLRHNLSYRDVEELLFERGVDVDQWRTPRPSSPPLAS